jgi:hypothetical protein
VTRDLSKNKCFFCLGRFGRSAASKEKNAAFFSMVLDEPLHSIVCMGQGEGVPSNERGGGCVAILLDLTLYPLAP